MEELGLPKFYNATNPAKWMATSTDVFELVNFFEAQNTSYEVDGHASGKKKEATKEAPAAPAGE
jgi:ribonucleoside-diphosphate reductase beta chain